MLINILTNIWKMMTRIMIVLIIQFIVDHCGDYAHDTSGPS